MDQIRLESALVDVVTGKNPNIFVIRSPRVKRSANMAVEYSNIKSPESRQKNPMFSEASCVFLSVAI